MHSDSLVKTNYIFYRWRNKAFLFLMAFITTCSCNAGAVVRQTKRVRNVNSGGERKHLDWIDGVKGLSAIIVVMHHLCLTYVGLNFNEKYYSFLPFFRLLINGDFAVHIFIVLSAYLLLYKLSNLSRKPEPSVLKILKDVLVGRYFRLMYSVGFVILLMYLLFYSGAFYAEEYGTLMDNRWLIGQYDDICNLPKYILLCPFGFTGSVLNVGWMLGYIYFGNVMAVLIWIVLRNRRSTYEIILLLALMIVLYIGRRSLITYVNVLFAYCLSYIDRNMNLLKNSKNRLCLLFICGLCLMELFSQHLMRNMISLSNLIIANLFIAIVYFSDGAKRFFSKPFFTFFGRISLGMYLLQLIVIYMLTCRLATLSLFREYKFLNILISFLVIAFIAWLYTKYIEPVFKILTKRSIGNR